MTPLGMLLSLTLAAITVLMLTRVACDWLLLLAGNRSMPGWIPRTAAVTRRLSEPILAPVRKILPAPRLGRMRIDLSPAVIIVGAAILQPLVLTL